MPGKCWERRRKGLPTSEGTLPAAPVALPIQSNDEADLKEDCLAIRFQTLKRLFWFQRKLWWGDWQRGEFDHLISWWTSLPCTMFSNSKVLWLLSRRRRMMPELFRDIDNFFWFNWTILCKFGALANIALLSAWPCLAKACTHLLLNGSEPFLWLMIEKGCCRPFVKLLVLASVQTTFKIFFDFFLKVTTPMPLLSSFVALLLPYNHPPYNYRYIITIDTTLA